MTNRRRFGSVMVVSWRRAFPALLLAKARGQLELDRLRSKTEHDQRSLLEDLLARGIAEGPGPPTSPSTTPCSS